MTSPDGLPPGELGGAPPFVVSSRREGSQVLLRLDGELDLNGVPMVDAEITRAVLDPQVDELALDLGGLGFIDSSGLQAMLNAWQRAEDAGMAFHLVSISDEATRTARLAGLDRLLALADP
jgi:anti-anti-sigma factor